VYAPGPVAEGKEHPAPQTTQECVERIAGGMGNTQDRANELKLQTIIVKFYNARCSSGQVEDQSRRTDEERQQGMPMPMRMGIFALHKEVLYRQCEDPPNPN